ncbi:transglutaminase-like domain-containing protein [Actinotalea solisilvae]|uniref:transglutaminase-like domain-containing protein n=1 Tax=Actinotalea solisilvae TaxID=2072922 RepID=UPI0018F12213|nr:transglutaminase domain-containing protein [Actinotalea solisilvae]
MTATLEAPAPRRERSRPAEPRARALRRQGTHPLVDAAVIALTTALALLPLVPVYGLRAALPPIVGGVLLGSGTALVAAGRRWGVLVTAGVAITVYLLAGGALAAPTTTVLGVVPSVDSLVLLLSGAVTVWKQVLTLDPSLGGSGNLLVAPYLLGFAATALGVGVARRTSPRQGAWAALAPLLVLGLAVLLGTKQTVAPVAAGVALVLLLAPWVAHRRGTLAPRRLVSLAVMAAVVVASGALAGPLLGQDRPRFVLRDELVPPFDPEDHPSPLSGFREFVKEWEDTDLVTVTGLPAGTPVRLATMDAFDGVVWNVAGSESAEGSGQFRRVGETITTSVRGERTEVEVEVHQLPSVWLPTVGYSERFDFQGPDALELSGDLRYNDATGTAVLADGIPAGTRWTAEVVVPSVPEDEEIGSASVGSVRLPEPQAVPEAVPLFAGELAGTASSPVLIARTLEQGLVERGWFSHGITESGDYPSLSGHGADRVTTLLTDDLMVGDGEQYASAMALMARQMGLPARVVLGFVPGGGDADGEDGAGDGASADEGAPAAGEPVTITGADIQAWVEISFAGHGWVPFFPTPDESKTPREDTPQEQSEPQPQVVQPPPPPQDPVTPPDDDTEQPRTDSPLDVPPPPNLWLPVLVLAGSVLVPTLLLLAPFVVIAVAKGRRRSRRRTEGPPVGRVVGGWEEVLDEARDLRRPPPDLATRRETAVHLATAFAATGKDAAPADLRGRRAAGVGGPVAGLAAGADAIVFGPGEPTPQQVEAYWAQVDATVRAMQAAVPGGQRLRARYSTRSLRARRRAEREARRAARAASRPKPTRQGVVE